MHRQYVHIDARTLAYLDSAPTAGSERVIALAHAFPLSASMWEPQFKSVPPGWRLIAIDLRGFGGSTQSVTDNENPATMDDYAEDVIQLLGELGVRSAVVGGLSMGGYVSFAVLRRAPQLVAGLVLADTRATADTSQGRANRRSMLALLDREGPSGIARDMIPKLLGETTRESRPDIESGVRRIIKQQSADAIRGAIMRMMARPDSVPVLDQVAVPTLIVVGEEDTLTPVADSQKMADAITAAELVVIPRAGHLANLEQTDAFNTALSGFLARL
jgi:3-oxoadipate enol-lactonase